MRYRSAYGGLSLGLIVGSVILFLLGFYWFFFGVAGKQSDLVLKGSFVIVSGLALGAIANFLK